MLLRPARRLLRTCLQAADRPKVWPPAAARWLATDAQTQTPPGVPKVTVDAASGLLRIDHHEETDGVYPHVWLRDNCRCPDCYHAPTGQRRLLLRHLDMEETVSDWSLDAAGTRLHVIWSDGHRSAYDLPWLLERSFAPAAVHRRSQADNDPGHPTPRPFGPDLRAYAVDFEAAVGDERQLYRLLHALKRDGLALLNATPTSDGLERLCAALAFPQETQYGVFYDVTVAPDPTNLAYTADTLGLHSDLPYMAQLPGIQVLQCVRQTADVTGGENLIADCRHVGRLLRERDPEAYKLLTHHPLRYWTRGHGHLKDYHLVAWHPVLKEDPATGEVAEIVYSDAIRDSLQAMPAEAVAPWYRALRTFHDLMMAEAFEHRLEDGQTLLLDNQRVVHGRNGYSMDASAGQRRLRGCYIPWDETESRLRRLAEKLGPGGLSD